MPSAQLSEVQLQARSEQLKSTRERRGDNLADAAFKIALSPSQLRAIEAADLRPFYSTGYFMQAVERYAHGKCDQDWLEHKKEIAQLFR